MYDLIIIGSGAAGLSAAVYAVRARFNVVVIEKEAYSGGQIVNTDKVDNYLGLYGKSGYEIATAFREHAESLGVSFIQGKAERIQSYNDSKVVILSDGSEYETKNVIIATGATHKKLGVPGEDELSGAGVSYCATCDGAFFRGRDVMCVGGGDVALQDALYLSNICRKVYLVHRRDTFRAAKNVQDKVLATGNIEFIPDSGVEEIFGKYGVEKVRIKNVKSREERELEVSGVFVAIGMGPASELVADTVVIDDVGYIVAGEDCTTNVDGIYAIGDVRTKELRQLITAVADGAMVIHTIEKKKL